MCALSDLARHLALARRVLLGFPLAWAALGLVLPPTAADARALQSKGIVGPRLELEEAVKRRDVDSVRALLAAGADPNARGGLQRTALHYAARLGPREVVRMLLDHGAEARVSDDDGQTPLHRGVEAGDTGIVLALIGAGADPFAENGGGETPVSIADRLGIEAVKRALREPPMSDSRGIVGPRLELEEAVKRRDVDLVRTLLAAGSNPNERGALQRTALHYAARLGPEEVVRLLLDSGAHAQASDDDGYTPLHRAVQSGNVGVVRQLIAAGADVSARTHGGETAGEIAARLGLEEVRRALSRTPN